MHATEEVNADKNVKPRYSRNETEPAGIHNFQNSSHIWAGMSLLRMLFEYYEFTANRIT